MYCLCGAPWCEARRKCKKVAEGGVRLGSSASFHSDGMSLVDADGVFHSPGTSVWMRDIDRLGQSPNAPRECSDPHCVLCASTRNRRTSAPRNTSFGGRDWFTATEAERARLTTQTYRRIRTQVEVDPF